MTNSIDPRVAPPSLPATDYPFGVGQGHFLVDGADVMETPAGLVRLGDGQTVSGLLAQAPEIQSRASSLTAGQDLVSFLACGSNASARRMREKLAGSRLPWAIGFRIETQGFSAVYAATMSHYGAIPATFADTPGRSAVAFLIVTPRDNIDLLNRTESESGNYDLYELAGDRGLSLDVPIHAYLCRYGALHIDGEPVALAEFSLPETGLRTWSQVEALAWAFDEARESVSPDEHGAHPDVERILRVQTRLRARREPVGMAGFRIVRFAAENRVRILRTPDRKRGSARYEVLVGKSLRKRLGLGRLAVLTCLHPGLQKCPRPGDDSRNDYLAAICRVKRAEKFGVLADDDVVLADQTLRTALGLPSAPFDHLHALPIFLMPAERSAWRAVREALAGVFGYRVLAMRCAIASIDDMEKRYAKLPADSLRTLGVDEGGDIVLERPFPRLNDSGLIASFVIKDIRLSAFSAPEGFIAERRMLARRFPRRYLNINRALFDYGNFIEQGLLNRADAEFVLNEMEGDHPEERRYEPDLPPIFMDGATRDFGAGKRNAENKANAFTVLNVRRSVASAIARDIVQVGAAFTISLVQLLLAFSVFFPDAGQARAIHLGPVVLSDTSVVIAVLLSVLMTAAFTAIRLRQRI